MVVATTTQVVDDKAKGPGVVVHHSERGLAPRLDAGRMLDRRQKVKFASAQFQLFSAETPRSALMDDDVTKETLFNFRHSTGGRVHVCVRFRGECAGVRARVRAHPSQLTGADC